MKTPFDVIREALLKPVPCPTCSSTKTCRCMPQRAKRLDTQAHMIWNDLIESGLLVPPQQAAEPTEAEIEKAAQYLARESGFIRYYDPDDPDGWQVLLTSPRDVELAYAKAKARNEGAAKEVTEGLSAAQSMLLDWISTRRAAQGEG